MIRHYLLTLCMLVFLAAVVAQTNKSKEQQKAEKELITYLNGILKASNTIHWAYKDGTMTTDPGFAIDALGILSVTVRFNNPDSGYYLVKLTAPVNRLITAMEDEYFLYKTSPDAVKIYESRGWNSNILRLARKDECFYIGSPRKYSLYRKFSIDKMQTLLDKVKKYYGA